jgi:hypothetical protein
MSQAIPPAVLVEQLAGMLAQLEQYVASSGDGMLVLFCNWTAFRDQDADIITTQVYDPGVARLRVRDLHFCLRI